MALQDLTPQLRTRLGRAERIVGLFLLLTVALMLAGLVYFVRHTAKERRWFDKKFPYYTFASEATGLKVGTPVTMFGFKVGEVKEIDQTDPSDWNQAHDYNVFVGFYVRHPYEGYILTDSRVKIGAGDFSGTRTLEITRGTKGLVTIKEIKDGPLLMLSDKFVYDTNLTTRSYLPLDRVHNGFWLQAIESQPLQQRLTDIANSINDALPQVFALTNQLAASLSNLTGVTAQFKTMMPKLDASVDQLNGLVADLRPALQKPGGLGDLIMPTNLNAQLTLTLSNLNPGSGPIALTLSNLNGRMADVGVALSNVNLQLNQNTNLLADANQLTRKVSSLAETFETLVKRHWLFRSAFKTNQPANKTSDHPDRPAPPPEISNGFEAAVQTRALVVQASACSPARRRHKTHRTARRPDYQPYDTEPSLGDDRL